MLWWRCLVRLVVLGLSRRCIWLLRIGLLLALPVLWLLLLLLLLLIQLRSVVRVVVLGYYRSMLWLSSVRLTMLGVPLLWRRIGWLRLMSTICWRGLLSVLRLLRSVRVSRGSAMVSAAISTVWRSSSTSATGMATALCRLLIGLAVRLLVCSGRCRRRSWCGRRRRRPVVIGHRIDWFESKAGN